MKFETVWVYILILVCALWAVTATAGDTSNQVLRMLTADDLSTMMQGWGYKATSKVRESGRPYVSSGAGGISFSIVFYDKKGDDVYEDIHMAAWFNDSFEGTMADANNWNLKNRHAYAVYDGNDNTVGLNMDLTVKGGVTEAYLETYIAMWGVYLHNFHVYLADAH